MRFLLAAAAAMAAFPAASATLSGWASLPADTFVPGPTSGQFITPANGRTPPFVGAQPVQGFSAILPNGTGGFLAMSDNGFGGQGNSADALLLVHDLSVDFRTAVGGTGTVTVNRSAALSDPNGVVPFPIVAGMATYPNGAHDVPVDSAIASGRLLTGADFDIESFRKDANGDYWFGDEFGPFLIRTNDRFEVSSVVATPGVQAPQNPFLGGASPNLPGSGGYEGMGISADGRTLYPLLERTVAGDPAKSLRIAGFDVDAQAFTGAQWLYRLEAQGTAIGDMTLVDGHRFVVIERDGTQGAAANFKRLFLIDLDVVDADGFLVKAEIADLMNIADPLDLNGDGSDLFTFPFVTIEDILVLDASTLLVANDNNYPFSVGRDLTGASPDDNELIRITLNAPLYGDVAPVPLPAAGWLLLAGLGGLAALRRRG